MNQAPFYYFIINIFFKLQIQKSERSSSYFLPSVLDS